MTENEYLWHPKVHATFGEELRFFFIRTAFTRLAADVFEKTIQASPTSASAYMLVGQYEFLVRSWGTIKANNSLHQQLQDRCLEFLGTCLDVTAGKVYYPWAKGDPLPADLKEFEDTIRRLKSPGERHAFIEKNYGELEKKKLVLSKLAERALQQDSGLSVFTVIRNLKLSAESRQIIELCLKREVAAYSKRGKHYDATLYSTTDNFDFVIRWHTPDFAGFIAILKEVIHDVEAEGAAAVFETYFVAERITPLRDNFSDLVDRGALVAKTSEDEWQEVVPQLKAVAPEVAQFLRLLCARPGVNVTPAAVRENRHLRSVLEAYLRGAVDQFAAFVQQYYSHFETLLRQRLVSRFWWPREAAGEMDAVRDEWCQILGRKEIPTGRDQGKTVPKLSMGDWLLLANQKLPERFDSSTARRMQDLVAMRNNLTHRGSSVIDLDYLPLFLGQAQACAHLLKAIDQSAATELN